jgi:hypothetical protein
MLSAKQAFLYVEKAEKFQSFNKRNLVDDG